MVDEPGSQPSRGVAAMAKAWRSFLSAWEAYRLEPVEYRALADDRVLVMVHAYGPARAAASS
jgi:hypothetical protein